MSVAELAAELTALQHKLVRALQDEYFCDDVSPPAEAFGWSEAALREFMESGGDVAAAVPTPAAPAPTTVGLPPLGAPATPPTAAGRPIILCLGDSLTEFGTHLINQPTADVGNKKSHSLSMVVEPVATEFLRSTETDNPGVEHGPGWTALLARDYAWRTAADVVNRGYSGMSSGMLLAALPELLAAFRPEDVVAVTLMVGANDAVAIGEATHVPLDQYADNLAAILAALKAALPKAHVIVLSPPPVDEQQWQATATKLTNGRKSGKERSHERNTEYAKAAAGAAKRAGASYIDLIYKLKFEFANAMMEMQNPHRDGLHFTKAVNIFIYRSIKSRLDELGLSASKMPRHWPTVLKAAYPHFADDDGRMRRALPKPK